MSSTPALLKATSSRRCVDSVFDTSAATSVVMSVNSVTFAARSFRPRQGASDEHIPRGSVRSEQRSRGRKEPPPGGLGRIWPGASLLVGHSPTAGGCSWCPCGSTSRLAPGQIGRNKRHWIYAHDH